MTIDIICPLYNAEKYIVSLQKSLEKQKNYDDIKNIRYIITKGKDDTEKLVNKIKDNNKKVISSIVESKDFSHSFTRENEAKKSKSDIIVFITQDVIIDKKDWLEKLVDPIEKGECEAAFSRQTCNDKKSIEYYTRKKNYPNESRITSKEDLKELGIKTYFYSDASSAIKREVFEELGWYDGKIFPTNEDMYIAYKLINNDYRIKYCADSEVIHSHNFSCKETYRRYKSYGAFLKQEPQINSKSTKAGGGLAKYIIISAIKDGNIRVIMKFLPDMIARYFGMKKGER